MKRFCGLMIVATLFSGGAVANAQSLPPYMAPIARPTSATPGDIATKDVLALNTGMFELYGEAANIFQKNILSQHPVILGLFSGAGGRLVLYRPGMPPLDAPPVPVVYQLLKSVGHSTMRWPKWSDLIWTIRPTDPGVARCSPTAVGCSQRLTDLMPLRWSRTGVPIIAPSCRTTLHSWMIALLRI